MDEPDAYVPTTLVVKGSTGLPLFILTARVTPKGYTLQSERLQVHGEAPSLVSRHKPCIGLEPTPATCKHHYTICQNITRPKRELAGRDGRDPICDTQS